MSNKLTTKHTDLLIQLINVIGNLVLGLLDGWMGRHLKS